MMRGTIDDYDQVPAQPYQPGRFPRPDRNQLEITRTITQMLRMEVSFPTNQENSDTPRCAIQAVSKLLSPFSLNPIVLKGIAATEHLYLELKTNTVGHEF